MTTRRRMVALIAVTALVFATPAAIAESPPPSSDPTAVSAPTSTQQPVAGPTSEPAPAPTAEPTAEPTPQATAEPTAEPAPQATAELTAEPTPAATAEPTAEPTPKPTTDRADEAAQQPTPDPTPEPTPDPTSTGGEGGTVCFLTSAGLICPGDPACVITSAGVSCASNCILTSAGLSCPQGAVQPNPPRGEVLSNPPVSGGPNRRGRNRRTAPDGEPTPVPSFQETGPRELPARALPFTGAPVLLWLGLGCAMLAGGMLLRRRSSGAGPALELAGDAEPLGAASVPPPADRLPSQRAIVLPAVALMACGMLLWRRTRRGVRGDRRS